MNIPSSIRQSTDNKKPLLHETFTYVTYADTLGPGITKTFNLQLQADTFFVVEKMSYFAHLAGAAQTSDTRVIPLVRVNITDTGTGRNMMSDAVDISAIAGHEGIPFLTPTTRWFLPNSTIKVQFDNYSASTTYNRVALYLHGQKVWF